MRRLNHRDSFMAGFAIGLAASVLLAPKAWGQACRRVGSGARCAGEAAAKGARQLFGTSMDTARQAGRKIAESAPRLAARFEHQEEKTL